VAIVEETTATAPKPATTPAPKPARDDKKRR